MPNAPPSSRETSFSEAMAGLAEGPRDAVGRRFAQAVVTMLGSRMTRPVVLARIRSASSHAQAAALVRNQVSRDLELLTRSLTDDLPETRAVLVGVQVVGLAFTRYVVGVEPLASMDVADLVDVLAPTFQRPLVGELAG